MNNNFNNISNNNVPQVINEGIPVELNKLYRRVYLDDIKRYNRYIVKSAIQELEYFVLEITDTTIKGHVSFIKNKILNAGNSYGEYKEGIQTFVDYDIPKIYVDRPVNQNHPESPYFHFYINVNQDIYNHNNTVQTPLTNNTGSSHGSQNGGKKYRRKHKNKHSKTIKRRKHSRKQTRKY